MNCGFSKGIKKLSTCENSVSLVTMPGTTTFEFAHQSANPAFFSEVHHMETGKVISCGVGSPFCLRWRESIQSFESGGEN